MLTAEPTHIVEHIEPLTAVLLISTAWLTLGILMLVQAYKPRHRRTDPACRRFLGFGTDRLLLGIRLRSPRRIRHDRARGRGCAVCSLERSAMLDRQLIEWTARR